MSYTVSFDVVVYLPKADKNTKNAWKHSAPLGISPGWNDVIHVSSTAQRHVRNVLFVKYTSTGKWKFERMANCYNVARASVSLVNPLILVDSAAVNRPWLYGGAYLKIHDLMTYVPSFLEGRRWPKPWGMPKRNSCWKILTITCDLMTVVQIWNKPR